MLAVRNRELTIVVLSFTLITLITTVATAAFTDIIWTWDGHNMYGEEVNDGVYIWEIEARTANGESQKETKTLGVLQ